MSLANEIEDALLELEDDLGTTFTWKNKEVPCVAHSANRGIAVPGAGAKEWIIQFSLDVRFSNFLTADSSLVTIDSTLFTTDNNTPHPVAGRSLIFRGRTYKIGTVSSDGTGAYYTLNLVDSNSGR